MPAQPVFARRPGRRALAGAALAVSAILSFTAARAEPVADWYRVTQSVREAVPPASDPKIETAAPLVALAIYDSVVAIDGGYRPYLGSLKAPSGASADAAA